MVVLAKVAMKCNIKSVMCWLDDSPTGGPLALSDICDEGGSTARDLLHAKHLPSQTAIQEDIISSISDSEEPHPVIFD